jgi:STE24 endopeptidase
MLRDLASAGLSRADIASSRHRTGCRMRTAILILSLDLFATSLHSFASGPVTIPPTTPRAIAFSHDANLLWLAGRIFLLGIPAVLLFTGLAGRLRSKLSALVRGSWFCTVTSCAVAYLAIFTLLFLPLEYALRRVLVGYGLSAQTTGQWLGEQGVGLAIKAVIVALVAWIPYQLLARSPHRWWLWSAVSLLPVVALLFVLQPLWIDPMFHSYKPLEDPRLRQMIATLAARGGLGDVPILQSDGDGTDSCGVACVTGLGPSRRIVISDTAAAHYSEREIASIVGHEMKHYLKDDNVKAFVIVSLLLLAGFWLTHRLGGAMVARWSRRFGVADLADPASVPLLVLCLTIVYVIADPVFLAYARHVEFEADRFGLEITEDNEAAATTLVKDVQLAPIVPNPGWFETVFRENHPSIADRIRFANTYHPWLEGKPLVYDDEFAKTGTHPARVD